VIHTLTASGSFLDGGPGRPIQRAALQVLESGRADQETDAVRSVFAAKHRMTIDKLKAVGVEFPVEKAPVQGTFYAWGSIANLPEPINEGLAFMREGFKHRVLTVPGEFFDVNPHRGRTGPAPSTRFVRFSFGPPRGTLEGGLDRLAAMIRSFQGSGTADRRAMPVGGRR
jgi:aspartate/methionine/tyrosine aminotransferase